MRGACWSTRTEVAVDGGFDHCRDMWYASLFSILIFVCMLMVIFISGNVRSIFFYFTG